MSDHSGRAYSSKDGFEKGCGRNVVQRIKIRKTVDKAVFVLLFAVYGYIMTIPVPHDMQEMTGSPYDIDDAAAG